MSAKCTAPHSCWLVSQLLNLCLSSNTLVRQTCGSMRWPAADGAAAAKRKEAVKILCVGKNENKWVLHPPAYQIQCSLNTKSVFTVISPHLVEEGTPVSPTGQRLEGLPKPGPLVR